MRSPFLALLPPIYWVLVFAIALAPVAPVRVVEEKQKVVAKTESAPEQESPESKDAPKKEQQRRPAPERAHWCALTPVVPTGSHSGLEDDVEPGLCPDLPPAIYARRLPAVPRIAEPPTEPDRVSLKSGHLTLPPPVA